MYINHSIFIRFSKFFFCLKACENCQHLKTIRTCSINCTGFKVQKNIYWEIQIRLMSRRFNSFYETSQKISALDIGYQKTSLDCIFFDLVHKDFLVISHLYQNLQFIEVLLHYLENLLYSTKKYNTLVSPSLLCLFEAVNLN